MEIFDFDKCIISQDRKNVTPLLGDSMMGRILPAVECQIYPWERKFLGYLGSLGSFIRLPISRQAHRNRLRIQTWEHSMGAETSPRTV